MPSVHGKGKARLNKQGPSKNRYITPLTFASLREICSATCDTFVPWPNPICLQLLWDRRKPLVQSFPDIQGQIMEGQPAHSSFAAGYMESNQLDVELARVLCLTHIRVPCY